MVKEGLITEEEAVRDRSRPTDLHQLLLPIFDPKAGKNPPRRARQGPARLAGAAVGKLAFTADEGRGWADDGRRSSSSGTRPRPRTSTACTPPRAS
jgi:hypothetical protein